MADRADDSSVRSTVEQLLLAGFGGLALTAERLEGLASAIAERSGIAPGEARQLVEDQLGRWRTDAGRLGGRAAQLGRELGLASREETEELRLKVAQLEHRLRLLEKD
jgi:polyhydroxyalkanoate synthesis regulator phasin